MAIGEARHDHTDNARGSFMETTVLLETLLKSRDIQELNGAFAEMRQQTETWRPQMRLLTAAALSSPDTVLADHDERRRLALAWLFLAMEQDSEALPPILELGRTAAFSTLIPEDDWLLREMPRVIGSLMQPGEMPQLSDWIADPATPPLLRDQLMMTIMFRWAGNRETNASVAAAVKKLLTGNWCDRDNAQLRMALIITAISVNEPGLKPKIIDFYHKSGNVTKDIIPEPVIEGFISLGPEKMLAMLREHYDSKFAEPEAEIKRLLTPPTNDPRKLVSREFGKPMVRETPKISRNDLCPCGSGKKYKKCCGK